MNPFQKLFYYIAWVGIAGAITIILILTYWFVAPYNVVTFQGDNAKLVETTVKSGGYLQIKQDYCKKMALPARVSCEFIDGLTYSVPVYNSDRDLGCAKRIEFKYVPKALSAGNYKLQCVYSYRVNPLRTVEYTLVTGIFTITK